MKKFLKSFWFVMIALSLLLIQCKKDEPVVAPGSDTTAPALSNRSLSITGISAEGFTVSWTAASDETTVAADLSYRLYYSATDFSNNAATAI
ncbi:MAG: hypothetical protein A2Y41_04070 [Spirochaetes bacterium GWB1_36_13]|nr:MAG: hypothetical protein A2Y41_04070 [Spirochaetes bacterium GWB1_36_13]